MKNIDINTLPSLEFEAGMLVEQRSEAVLCNLTAAIAQIIGAIFFAPDSQ